jgi:hypothetical protein
MNAETQLYHVEQLAKPDGLCEAAAIVIAGRFRGCWTCKECGAVGSSAATYLNLGTALSWARLAAAEHRLDAHSQRIA